MALSPLAMHRRLQPHRFARRRTSLEDSVSSVERFGSAPFSFLSLSFSPSPLEILLSPLKKSLQTPHTKSTSRKLAGELHTGNMRKIFSESTCVDLQKPLFQLFFLKNDEKQSVEVFEVEEIDFPQVISHLKQGESVFMTWKRKSSTDSKSSKHRTVREESRGFWPA